MTENDEREALRGVLVNVLCNASNFPERVASRILGQDMGPLIERTVDAILAAGFRRELEPRDERIEAWDAVASHPFFRDCYATEGTLLAAMLAKLSSEPRTINTPEEVDALPLGSLIREHDGFHRFKEGEWSWLLCVPRGGLGASDEIELPATILYTPEATK